MAVKDAIAGEALAGDAIAGAQDPSDLVFRRLGNFRISLATAAFMAKTSLILRTLAASTKRATESVWAASPRILRRPGPFGLVGVSTTSLEGAHLVVVDLVVHLVAQRVGNFSDRPWGISAILVIFSRCPF